MKGRLILNSLAVCFFLVALIAAGCAGNDEKEDPAVFLGRFSNMEFTEEHAYGSWVDLWKIDEELVGHFYNAEGMAGDTPRGILEKVEYEPSTGKINFKVKLSMGVISWSGKGESSMEVWSRDLFVFNGTLSSDSIIGILELRNGWEPGAPLQTTQQIVLKKERSEYLESLKFESRSAWDDYSRKLAKKRDPEW